MKYLFGIIKINHYYLNSSYYFLSATCAKYKLFILYFLFIQISQLPNEIGIIISMLWNEQNEAQS